MGDESVFAVGQRVAERVRVLLGRGSVRGEPEVHQAWHVPERPPVLDDERERLVVVGIAVPVQAGAVVPCDSGPVRVRFAHSGELADGGHGSLAGGHDDAHGQSSLLAARRIAGVVSGVR